MTDRAFLILLIFILNLLLLVLNAGWIYPRFPDMGIFFAVVHFLAFIFISSKRVLNH